MREKEGIMGGDEYGSGKIQVMKGLEHVRKRPSMYIGSTGMRGLRHLINEVVDNAIDEAMVGYCDRIKVEIQKDGSVIVEDNGRGIPVDIHPTEKVPGVELVLTTLYSGGKFDNKVYKVSGGLHGVGVSVVNALAEWLVVEVYREGNVYRQQYKRGVPVTGLEVSGKKRKTGTKIHFMPDREIFDEIDYERQAVASRLRELAFLNKGLTIIFRDHTGEEKFEEEYRYAGGTSAFVLHLTNELVGKKALYKKPVHFEAERDGTIVEISILHNESYRELIYTFVNNINTHEGGTHLSGLKSALTRTINDYARRNNFLKNNAGKGITGEDVREGLVTVLNLRIREPQFEGQTKTKLGNSEVKGLVESIIYENLSSFLEEHPPIARRIIEKAMEAMRIREAERKARELTRIPCRGGLRGRIREAGEGPEISGHPAAPREDFECREVPAGKGPQQRGDKDPDYSDRNRSRITGIRYRESKVSQTYHHDGRRRGRRTHPDTVADVLLPSYAGAHRRGVCLYRSTATLQGFEWERGAIRLQRGRDG
jgi:DNA gyrase subunit B